MKPTELVQLLRVAIRNKINVLIKGKPGIGKTDIVMQACAIEDYDTVLSHPVVDDPTDYKGMPCILKNKEGEERAEFMPFGNLEKIITASRPTAYFMDDLGQALPAVQAAGMQLLLAKEINGQKVSPFVSFIAATNRKADKAGVSGILEPVKSRFGTIVELDTDLEDWVDWGLKSKKIPVDLIAFIRFRPEQLDTFKATSDLTNSSCPRTVENVAKWMKAGLPQSLEFETYEGAAGKAFASELMSFLKIFRQLPDPLKIIQNPDGANIPDEPAALYATCGALAARANLKNFENICKYAYRMPKEFSVFMVKDCVRQNEDVAETDSFIQWVAKHKSSMI
jgi:hypothetical protein